MKVITIIIIIVLLFCEINHKNECENEQTTDFQSSNCKVIFLTDI